MGVEASQTLVPERLRLLRIPLDIIHPEELGDFIFELLKNKAGHIKAVVNNTAEGKNIVLLSLWDLLKARRNREYRSYVINASLVVPISKSLVNGARFLRNKTPVRYMPFHFAIALLSILESREYTVYLLGGDEKILKRAENNIHQTFPRLRIIGRCRASFSKQDEDAVVEAIRKTAPQLLLVGKGVKGGELWINRNHRKLNSGIRIWCSDLFDVFAERKRRPSETIFDLGLEGIGYCFRNPLKFLRIIPYFRYKILLLIYKIFDRD